MQYNNAYEPSDITAAQEATERELLREIIARFNNALLPTTCALLYIAYLGSGVVSTAYWASWLIAALVIQAAQWPFYNRFISLYQCAPGKKMTLAAGINLARSICFSMSLFYFPMLEPPLQIALALLLAAIGRNFIASASGYSPFLLTHIVTVVIPLAALWIYYLPADSSIQYTLFTVVVIYVSGQLYASRRNHPVFYSQLQARINLEQSNSKLHYELAAALGDIASKARLLAAASHDLRQPIHSLTLFCSALTMKPLDDNVRDIADSMTTAVESLGAQLDAVLDLSKLDAGIVPVNKGDFDLSLMLARIYSDFLPLATAKSLAMQIDCPPRCAVFTDNNLLERVLRNLLSNAVKYTDQGKVSIQVIITDDHVFVNIIDTGIGIAEQDQESIFEEFHQFYDDDRNRRKHRAQFNSKNADRRKGLGLGLSIVRRHTTLLGAELKLYSKPRIGSIFSLKLVKGSRHDEPKKNNASDDMFWSALTILLINDTDNCQEMKTLLEILGCTVMVAENTGQALSPTTAYQADVAILDFQLSEKDNGLATVQLLRTLYPGLPTIITSGDTEPSPLAELQASGTAVLHKPVLVESLKLAILSACQN